MEMKENSQKKVLLSVLGVAILVVAVIGISFAAYTTTFTTTGTNSISTGTIMVSYAEPSNAINIQDAMPLSDENGIAQTGVNKSFDFTVSTQASNTLTVPYTITLTKVTAKSTLEDSQMKVYLTKEGTAVLNATNISDLTADTTRAGSKVLYSTNDSFSGKSQPAKTTNYVLKMWIDGTVDATSVEGKTYAATVNVDSAVAPLA